MTLLDRIICSMVFAIATLKQWISILVFNSCLYVSKVSFLLGRYFRVAYKSSCSWSFTQQSKVQRLQHFWKTNYCCLLYTVHTRCNIFCNTYLCKWKIFSSNFTLVVLFTFYFVLWYLFFKELIIGLHFYYLSDELCLLG